MSLRQLFLGLSKNATEEEKEAILNFSNDDWAEHANAQRQILSSVMENLKQNIPVADPKNQQLILRFYEWTKKSWQPDRDSWIALAKSHTRKEMGFMFDAFDANHPRLANYLYEAIKIFAERNLINDPDSERKLLQVKENQSFLGSLAEKKESQSPCYKTIVSELETIFHKLANLYREDANPKSNEVQTEIQSYYSWFHKIEVSINKEKFLDLINQYNNPDQQELLKPYCTDQEFVEFLKESIKIFAHSL